MKIACLISSLQLGGAERQILALRDFLCAEGHEVTLLTYRDKTFYDSEHVNLGGGKGLIRRIASYMKESGSEIMISFLPGPSTKACIAHMLYPKFRLIVSERNFNTWMSPKLWLRLVLFQFGADVITCNSYAQKSFISKRFPSLKKKLAKVSNFIDTDVFHPGEEHPAKGSILAAGRICRRKNVLGLIKATAILKRQTKNIRIDWYGSVKSGRYMKKCLKLIRKYGLEENLRILPATKNIAEIYWKYAIFCLPSFTEGTSNSLCEAVASGLLTVCSNVSDNPLYSDITFNPHSPKDIANKLQKALELSENENIAIKRERITSICCSNLWSDVL